VSKRSESTRNNRVGLWIPRLREGVFGEFSVACSFPMNLSCSWKTLIG